MSKNNILEQLRECAFGSKHFVLGLIGNIAGTVADALEEMETAKADKPAAVPIVIPASGWESDSDVNYPLYYDIPVVGVTANDRAEITVATASIDVAMACGLCPVNETMADKIRVRSISVPASAITAEYWLEKGKE